MDAIYYYDFYIVIGAKSAKRYIIVGGVNVAILPYKRRAVSITKEL